MYCAPAVIGFIEYCGHQEFVGWRHVEDGLFIPGRYWVYLSCTVLMFMLVICRLKAIEI